MCKKCHLTCQRHTVNLPSSLRLFSKATCRIRLTFGYSIVVSHYKFYEVRIMWRQGLEKRRRKKLGTVCRRQVNFLKCLKPVVWEICFFVNLYRKKCEKFDPYVIRTRNLLIWSQTRYRCAKESADCRCDSCSYKFPNLMRKSKFWTISTLFVRSFEYFSISDSAQKFHTERDRPENMHL